MACILNQCCDKSSSETDEFMCICVCVYQCAGSYLAQIKKMSVRSVVCCPYTDLQTVMSLRSQVQRLPTHGLSLLILTSFYLSEVSVPKSLLWFTLQDGPRCLFSKINTLISALPVVRGTKKLQIMKRL